MKTTACRNIARAGYLPDDGRACARVLGQRIVRGSRRHQHAGIGMARRPEDLLSRGDFDKAADCYRKALELEPGMAAARAGLDKIRDSRSRDVMAAQANP